MITTKILIILLRFNKIGLVYDPDSRERIDDYLPPLGLAYISVVLKRAGKDVTILNLNNRKGKISELIQAEMGIGNYDIVITGGLSLFYPHVKEILDGVKTFSSKPITIVGGGLMSAQPEIMFNLLKPDFGVIGEGEETVLELVNYLENPSAHPVNINGIKGIVFEAWRMPENKVKLCINKQREPIMDLDTLPFPDYESFGYAEYLDRCRPTYYPAFDVVDDPRPYAIVASRSCPFSCTFCYHPLGQKYRQRSIDNIMEEIKQNVKLYGVNIILIYDELFSNDRDRMMEFCAKFKAYADTLPYKLWFWCNNRVDTTTEEMLKAMKESGAFMLAFGFESASPAILQSMHKHTEPEQIERVLILLRKYKLGLMASFIFGDVKETCTTARETLAFIKKNRKLMGGGCPAMFIIPFQGTPIYKQCVREGIIKDEVAFIEERAREGYKHLEPLNMTGLTDEQFADLKDAVFEPLLVSDTYAVVKHNWKDLTGNTSVMIECPDCGKISIIKNVPIPSRFGLQDISCRHCFFRFHMVSGWYPIGRVIIKLLKFRRVYWIHMTEVKLKKMVTGR